MDSIEKLADIPEPAVKSVDVAGLMETRKEDIKPSSEEVLSHLNETGMISQLLSYSLHCAGSIANF